MECEKNENKQKEAGLAHFLKKHFTHDHQDESSNDHEDSLNKVCPNDCGKTSGDTKESGQDEKNQDGDVEARLAGEPHRVFDE